MAATTSAARASLGSRPLTAAEKEELRIAATDEIKLKRRLLEKHYLSMYEALKKAFLGEAGWGSKPVAEAYHPSE